MTTDVVREKECAGILSAKIAEAFLKNDLNRKNAIEIKKYLGWISYYNLINNLQRVEYIYVHPVTPSEIFLEAKKRLAAGELLHKESFEDFSKAKFYLTGFPNASSEEGKYHDIINSKLVTVEGINDTPMTYTIYDFINQLHHGFILDEDPDIIEDKIKNLKAEIPPEECLSHMFIDNQSLSQLIKLMNFHMEALLKKKEAMDKRKASPKPAKPSSSDNHASTEQKAAKKYSSKEEVKKSKSKSHDDEIDLGESDRKGSKSKKATDKHGSTDKPSSTDKKTSEPRKGKSKAELEVTKIAPTRKVESKKAADKHGSTDKKAESKTSEPGKLKIKPSKRKLEDEEVVPQKKKPNLRVSEYPVTPTSKLHKLDNHFIDSGVGVKKSTALVPVGHQNVNTISVELLPELLKQLVPKEEHKSMTMEDNMSNLADKIVRPQVLEMMIGGGYSADLIGNIIKSAEFELLLAETQKKLAEKRISELKQAKDAKNSKKMDIETPKHDEKVAETPKPMETCKNQATDNQKVVENTKTADKSTDNQKIADNQKVVETPKPIETTFNPDVLIPEPEMLQANSAEKEQAKKHVNFPKEIETKQKSKDKSLVDYSESQDVGEEMDVEEDDA